MKAYEIVVLDNFQPNDDGVKMAAMLQNLEWHNHQQAFRLEPIRDFVSQDDELCSEYVLLCGEERIDIEDFFDSHMKIFNFECLVDTKHRCKAIEIELNKAIELICESEAFDFFDIYQFDNELGKFPTDDATKEMIEIIEKLYINSPFEAALDAEFLLYFKEHLLDEGETSETNLDLTTMAAIVRLHAKSGLPTEKITPIVHKLYTALDIFSQPKSQRFAALVEQTMNSPEKILKAIKNNAAAQTLQNKEIIEELTQVKIHSAYDEQIIILDCHSRKMADAAVDHIFETLAEELEKYERSTIRMDYDDFLQMCNKYYNDRDFIANNKDEKEYYEELYQNFDKNSFCPIVVYLNKVKIDNELRDFVDYQTMNRDYIILAYIEEESVAERRIFLDSVTNFFNSTPITTY